MFFNIILSYFNLRLVCERERGIERRGRGKEIGNARRCDDDVWQNGIEFNAIFLVGKHDKSFLEWRRVHEWADECRHSSAHIQPNYIDILLLKDNDIYEKSKNAIKNATARENSFLRNFRVDGIVKWIVGYTTKLLRHTNTHLYLYTLYYACNVYRKT